MIVDSIQRVISITGSYIQQQVIAAVRDAQSQKITHDVITYRVYNKLGQIEQLDQHRVDLRV